MQELLDLLTQPPCNIQQEEYISFTTMHPRPKFILFGDSITEQGVAPHGWHTLLANAYARRVDVINRGLSGYNTRWALETVPALIEEFKNSTVKLLTLAFGANDAALPESRGKRQYVSVEEYGKNLIQMVQMFQHAFKDAMIVLITPPPVNDKVRDSRTLQHARIYAERCTKVGLDMDVAVVDTWTGLQKYPEWETKALADGLHLTKEGNELFYCLVQQTLNSQQLQIPQVPRQFPDHKAIDESNPKAAFL